MLRACKARSLPLTYGPVRCAAKELNLQPLPRRGSALPLSQQRVICAVRTCRARAESVQGRSHRLQWLGLRESNASQGFVRAPQGRFAKPQCLYLLYQIPESPVFRLVLAQRESVESIEAGVLGSFVVYDDHPIA